MDQINTLIYCVPFSLSLFHLGRLKERTSSSLRTAVSPCGFEGRFTPKSKIYIFFLFACTAIHPSVVLRDVCLLLNVMEQEGTKKKNQIQRLNNSVSVQKL